MINHYGSFIDNALTTHHFVPTLDSSRITRGDRALCLHWKSSFLEHFAPTPAHSLMLLKLLFLLYRTCLRRDFNRQRINVQ